jgi:hypothetical protein
MAKLITINEINDEEFINSILNDEIIVYEDVQGSKIWVNYDPSAGGFTIKPKSLSNDPINMVDLAMQNYYNDAINYFNSLEKRVVNLLNKKWWFCFEYFPDNQPANIEYSRIPKNKLVLTYINKSGKYEFNTDELNEYSRLLDVDRIPIIYQGTFTEKMKEAIKYFINTSTKDLGYIFGEKSFSYFFYKILTPNIENSFLMNEGEFQTNLEKLIIKSKNREYSFQLLNPLYQRLNNDSNTEFVEVYSLILMNFLNFAQSMDIEEIKIKGDSRDEAYIYLISNMYNVYISEVGDDLINFDFIVPEFFDKEKFRINIELIKNKLTRDYIKSDKKFEYVFKIVLGSFNKKKKKPIGIFTETSIELFNNFVDRIDNAINKYLGKKNEIELTKAGLLDFTDFFDIKYDIDGEGDVYLDVYDEFSKASSEDKKDKKGEKWGKDTDIQDYK